MTGAVQPGVVAVGKKSLLWLPFFGLIFWLSGNVLIDRSNRSRAIGTIGQVVERIKNRGTSIWMFPEGTRSKGRGLLPFKAGAFHTAVQAEVPVVPIVCSSYFGQIDLNRWDNGEVLLEVMARSAARSTVPPAFAISQIPAVPGWRPSWPSWTASSVIPGPLEYTADCMREPPAPFFIGEITTGSVFFATKTILKIPDKTSSICK